MVKAQHDFFKDSTFVKSKAYVDNDTPPNVPVVGNTDCALVAVLPKIESFDLNECKVELDTENGKDFLHYRNDCVIFYRLRSFIGHTLLNRFE